MHLHLRPVLALINHWYAMLCNPIPIQPCAREPTPKLAKEGIPERDLIGKDGPYEFHIVDFAAAGIDGL